MSKQKFDRRDILRGAVVGGAAAASATGAIAQPPNTNAQQPVAASITSDAAGYAFFNLEEAAFIEFLESTGPVVGVRKGKVPDKAQLHVSPLRSLLAEGADSVLVGLPGLLGELPIRGYLEPAGESWAVLFTRLPVLTYRRGIWRSPERLGSSHISGNWTILSDDQTKVLDQPAEFVKWGRKVLAWVRKQAPESREFSGHRITKGVSEAIKSSGIQLVP